MATIRATCPDCGDVELASADVTVRLCEDDQRGSYAFRCPSCLLAVAKGAEARVVDLLVSSGVELQCWRLPDELREVRMGALFTHDDLLSFHERLDGPAWFAELSAMVRR